MMWQITSFEFKGWLRSRITYVFIIILFVLGFLMANFYGAALGLNFMILSSKKFDSHFGIQTVMMNLSLLGALITSMIFGLAVYKDYLYNTSAITFSNSSSKFNYLLGRFGGALLVCLVLGLVPYFGYGLGVHSPWFKAKVVEWNFGAFRYDGFLLTYLNKTVLFFFYSGAIFFMLSSITKNTLYNWLAIAAIYGLSIWCNSIFADYDLRQYHELVALIDPLGIIPDKLITLHWSADEINSKLVPYTNLHLWNRVIWCTVGVLALIITYFRVNLSESEGNFRILNLFRKKQLTDSIGTATINFRKIVLPSVTQDFSYKNEWSVLRKMTWLNIKRVFFSPFFLIFLCALFLYLKGGMRYFGTAFGVNSYPYTYLITQGYLSMTDLYILLIIIWMAGELIWRDRNLRTNELLDTYPVSNKALFLSQALALSIIPLIILMMVMFLGIQLQMKLDFHEHEIGLYVKNLFIIEYVNYLPFIVLVILVFSLVNNKYLGIVILVLYYFVDKKFLQGFIKHNMLLYGGDPGVYYSDMLGFSNTLFPYFMFKAYWVAFAGLLTIVISRVWPRGTEFSFKVKWKNLRERAKSQDRIAIAGFGIPFIVMGIVIFYNIYGLGNYRPPNLKDKANYELEYKKYEQHPIPKITDVYAELDLYPEKQGYELRGYYWLKNKTKSTIDKLLVNYGRSRLSSHFFQFDRHAEIEQEYDELGVSLYRFAEPLQPGDSIKAIFEFTLETKGFYNSSRAFFSGKPIANGTFLNHNLMPTFGYLEGRELSGELWREKYGLPPKKIDEPEIGDPVGSVTHWMRKDSDLVNFETILSTSEDQTAIAPGYLQGEWKKGGRSYFHYKMDIPINNFYSFLSGDYERYHEDWNGINLEIFYHPRHNYNLESIMAAMKKSLQYYSEQFSPYQYDQMRIIEFPDIYGAFAQSYPNTVPFSESAGFRSDLREKSIENKATLFGVKSVRFDNAFYVTAHEVAHQWWGHQINGAHVQGVNFLSESMSQYAALMVLESEFGMRSVIPVLEREWNSYLGGRKRDRHGERPVVFLRGNQSYLAYNKGAIVMYALRNYLGAEVLNGAIREFINENAFQGPPYTDTKQFLQKIRKVTPDSLQYVIDDWFEDIILYDNKVISATYERNEDFDYEVEMTIDFKKFRSDAKGNESSIKMDDYVRIGIYHDTGKELYHEFVKVVEGQQKIKTTLSRRPEQIIVDPDFSLIDKDRDNNMMKFKKKE